MLNVHGGNIYKLASELNCSISKIIDMSSNVNPVGTPPQLVEYISNNINSIGMLPEVNAGHLIKAFAIHHNIHENNIAVGNGTTQIIYTIPMSLNIKKAVIVGPTYSDYADACKMHQVEFDYILASEKDDFKPELEQVNFENVDAVFICNPNNPTGFLIPKNELITLCKSNPSTYFIIDESYLPFVLDYENLSLINCNLPNTIVLNSFSKIFCIPGIRIGFMTASKEIIKKQNHYEMPWSVNSLAQKAGMFLLENHDQGNEFISHTCNYLAGEKKRMINGLNAEYYKAYESVTSFILIKILKDMTSDMICSSLSKEGILIRNCSNFMGLNNSYIRISLKKYEINSMIVEKLNQFF